MQNGTKPVCFVVMPFGKKPISGDGNRVYDFDKVYRVIIQKAIERAGLQPIRADERLGSAIIHSDMFKDLRDQPIVLADLSLDNPNVYYELGIRHVMSPTGTVLMCRKGSTLPFDIKLSRVTFYEYDGISLDYEEAERVVNDLTAALQDALRSKKPDSPVHALLEPVFSRQQTRLQSADIRKIDLTRLSAYQQMIAKYWQGDGKSIVDFIGAQNGRRSTYDAFGYRCLAYFCMRTDASPLDREEVAKSLNDWQQFELTVELLEPVKDELTFLGLHLYATAYSEIDRTLAGADAALEYTREAFRRIQKQYQDPRNTEARRAYANAQRRLAGLLEWRWLLTRDADDLNRTIEALADAAVRLDELRRLGRWRSPGIIAQAHFRHLLLLRLRDGNAERPDDEGNIEAILSLEPVANDRETAVSWLRWFKAIVTADGGSEDAQRLAIEAVTKDAELKTRHPHIGRWQYRNLRRFIDQHLDALRSPSTVAMVTRVLHAAEDVTLEGAPISPASL